MLADYGQPTFRVLLGGSTVRKVPIKASKQGQGMRNKPSRRVVASTSCQVEGGGSCGSRALHARGGCSLLLYRYSALTCTHVGYCTAILARARGNPDFIWRTDGRSGGERSGEWGVERADKGRPDPRPGPTTSHRSSVARTP